MATDKWLFPLFSAAFVSLILVFSAISGFTASSAFFYHRQVQGYPPVLRRGSNHPPTFAYYISGGRGDSDRLIRLLLAVYHPRNCYLLHLNAEAPQSEREALATAANSAVPAIRVFGNVHVVGNPDPNTNMGSSVLAAILHAASLLLRLDARWDWFLTLSSADYPLVTQDDLFHVFSTAPRDLNFIDHTSDIGWKEPHRVQPIVVDPAIYLARRAQIFRATETRQSPDSFKFFTGSPWVILSRSFVEFCILGWDNLPRTLLMYFTNVLISQESYFHSVICNSPDFLNTTVNNDLRYMVWDTPPLMEPHFLNVTDYDEIEMSAAPFARKFQKDDPVLDKIDRHILRRGSYQAVPGAWCSGKKNWWADPCSKWGDVNAIHPGPRAVRFGELMTKLLDDRNSKSCK